MKAKVHSYRCTSGLSSLARKTVNMSYRITGRGEIVKGPEMMENEIKKKRIDSNLKLLCLRWSRMRQAGKTSVGYFTNCRLSEDTGE